ncbi:MAG: UDP-N-acetylglucosamine 1-carboxyvinyltransferase [Pseudoflavonifractor sp.]
MSAFIVEGGNRLVGTARVHGAKNSVLPILAATILARGECILHHCPDLSDVAASLAILTHLGCKAVRQGESVIVDTAQMSCSDVPDALMREMRSSVIFLGAILGRMGQAKLCAPGGCELGPRPIDLHLAAIRALGATVEEHAGGLTCTGLHMTGCTIDLSIPSVGATENAMLAALSAEGITTITNAAREPEIVDLQNFIRAMGGQVQGAGSSTVTIVGGKILHGCEHAVIADRIVGATLLSAVATAGGEVLVTGAEPAHLATVISALEQAGCTLKTGPEGIFIRADGMPAAIDPVVTAPYPGFPTDAQAPLMAALCKSRGTSVFEENMFESRYRHVQELCSMGADIRVEGKTALVRGAPMLHGGAVHAPDLRGGAALVIAALGAEGQSRITGLHHIDRGYCDLDGTLRSLGARILRED